MMHTEIIQLDLEFESKPKGENSSGTERTEGAREAIKPDILCPLKIKKIFCRAPKVTYSPERVTVCKQSR